MKNTQNISPLPTKRKAPKARRQKPPPKHKKSTRDRNPTASNY